MLPAPGRSIITALLGPTNTGKTHRAVTRMLEHDSGMIGLPLRLLAREVYDRISAQIGEQAVALVTGEEKRIPAHPRYWVCTVEAMPLDRVVDFLAVDEVQLSAHRERGHVFTDRLLHARGERETWFMGSDTMSKLVSLLLPTASIRTHPRLSRLSATGSCSLSTVPPRSAVVAFSANRVYEIAERLRTKRGGAAVVLGALSPRARNAQVALYQSGEVSYMVATDAIGMGLNMDVRHIAFADLRKFDGKETRELEAAELAQIAGRAGRHHNDGTFGTLAPLPALPTSLARTIEQHRFPAVTRLWYRNSDLDASSIETLLDSLRQKPPHPCLRLFEQAEDYSVLMALSRRSEIKERARGPEAVSLLWEVCQIPDYRQLLLNDHESLLAEIYLQLTGPRGKLDSNWIAERIGRIDDTKGEIDGLLMRLAFIRTWTYISHHTRWLANAGQWQERARSIEDRLSDALHERLVLRFVDGGRNRSSGVRSRKRPRPDDPVDDREAPLFNPFLKLQSMRIQLAAPQVAAKPEATLEDLIDAPHEDFRIDPPAMVVCRDIPVARMVRGSSPVLPKVALCVQGELAPGEQHRLDRRVLAYTRDLVDSLLGPLRQALRCGSKWSADGLSAAGRGLVYQLEQGLGTVALGGADDQVPFLTMGDREILSGVHIGRRTAYLPKLLKPGALRVRAALATAFWAVPMEAPPAGRLCFRAPPSLPHAALSAIGYPTFGGWAIRADIAEKVVHRLLSGAASGALLAVLGCRKKDAASIAYALGFAPGGAVPSSPLADVDTAPSTAGSPGGGAPT